MSTAMMEAQAAKRKASIQSAAAEVDSLNKKED